MLLSLYQQPSDLADWLCADHLVLCAATWQVDPGIWNPNTRLYHEQQWQNGLEGPSQPASVECVL